VDAGKFVQGKGERIIGRNSSAETTNNTTKGSESFRQLTTFAVISSLTTKPSNGSVSGHGGLRGDERPDGGTQSVARPNSMRGVHIIDKKKSFKLNVCTNTTKTLSLKNKILDLRNEAKIKSSRTKKKAKVATINGKQKSLGGVKRVRKCHTQRSRKLTCLLMSKEFTP
jgi:hypothetical protein